MKTSWLVPAVAVAILLVGATSALRADEASHLQAARDLLTAAKIDVVYDQAIEQMLDAQTKASPRMASLRGPMKDFFTKYMGWDSMKEDMAKLYADHFTEDELKQITAFYQSPIGSKLIMEQPDLMRQGSMLGQQRVAAHMGELQQIIMDAMMQKNGTGTSANP